MTVSVLKAAQRGQMKNSVFEGRTVFSNGMPNTNRPDHFGMIYIFNDDILYPKSHLGMHPHRDVEIITLMISGIESHQDTLGIHEDYRAGEVQLISSGSGLHHEGGNVSDTENARHLQLWIAPRRQGLPPSVRVLKPADTPEKVLVSPDGAAGSLPINQDVWLYQLTGHRHTPYHYPLKDAQHGVLVYVLNGTLSIDGHTVTQEDTAFISDTPVVDIISETSETTFVLIETRMS